jgi:hypothetical protein
MENEEHIPHQDHCRQTLRTHSTGVYPWLLCLEMKFLLSRSAVHNSDVFNDGMCLVDIDVLESDSFRKPELYKLEVMQHKVGECRSLFDSRTEQPPS